MTKKISSDSTLASAFAWWVASVVRHPLLVILAMLLITAAALDYTRSNLKVNTDTSNLLSAELPFRKAYLQFEEIFPQQINTFLVVIDGETPMLSRTAAKRLASSIRSETDIIAEVYTPRLSAFFDQNALLYLDSEELVSLTDRLSALQPFLATLISDQSLRGLLEMLGKAFTAVTEGENIDLQPILTELNKAFASASKGKTYRMSWQKMMQGDNGDTEGKRQIVIVKPRMDFSELQPAEASINLVRQRLQELQITPENGLQARLTGLLALEYEELQSVKKGGIAAAVMSLLMAVLALWFAFRSTRLVAATFILLIVGLILTASFAALTVGQLNMITVAFGVLYIGLGVDFAIHFGLRFRELHDQKTAIADALRGAASDIGPSLLLCAVTTAVGFFSFIPTDYLGVSELGIISGSGMFISLLLTLTLLPALLSIRPFRIRLQKKRSLPSGAPALLIHLPLQHPAGVRRLALAVALAAVCALPWVHFDYDPLALRDPDSESVKTFKDLMQQSETPPKSITILAPDHAAASDMVRQLKNLPSVSKVLFIDSFVPDAQAEKLAAIEDLEIILGPELEPGKGKPAPTTGEQLQEIDAFGENLQKTLQSPQQPAWRDQAAELEINLQLLKKHLSELSETDRAQRLANLEKGLLETFPESIQTLKTSLRAEPFTVDDLPGEIIQRWIGRNAIYRIEVFPVQDLESGDELRRFVDEVRSIAADATGPPVVALESGKAVIAAFQQAFLGALLVISILLIGVLRRLRDALLVVIPLLWAGLLTAAMTVLLDIPFNFANIIALPLLLGIGVDNGIHVIHRIRSNGQSYAQLLQSSTARGIYYSAITTIVSFLSLGFSAHPGTASMGIILTMGVLLTLIGTLIILPAMLAPARGSAT